jgi:DNA-binding CsgD family transcriptional regulator
MGKTPARLVGRDTELAELAADGPGGVVAVLVGERGSGRTALLGALDDRARENGRPSLTVDLAGPRPEWDHYGVVPLLDAVTDGFEQLDAAGDLVERTASLRNRCTQVSYDTTVGRGALHLEMGRLLAGLGTSGLVLVDDADHVPAPGQLLTAARSAGHRIVATSGRDAALTGMADAVVSAAPITDDDLWLLVRRAVRGKPDAQLVESVRAALGPLAGNPSAVLAVLDRLRDSDRLVTVARRVCLRTPDRTPTFPPDAPAMTAAGYGCRHTEDLVLLVDGPGRVRAEDVPLLAAATGRSIRETGMVVDRLVVGGTLDERDGELVVSCPAVGATLREHAGPDRIRSLHTAVVEAAVRGPARPEAAELADHVAAAGDTLPRDPKWAGLLCEQARERAHATPGRAARLLRAAEHHAPGGAPGPAVGWVVRVLLRAGDHDGAVRAVSRAVDTGVADTDRVLLAAAAAVAALSSRKPVPGRVQAELGRGPGVGCPLDLLERWRAGEPVDAAELQTVTAPLAPTRRGPGRVLANALRAAEAALVSRDVVGALESLLGSEYRRPSEGPHLRFQRVVAAMRTGSWDEAMTESRGFLVEYGTDDDAAATREIIALLGVDAAIWNGDERMVAAWQDHLPDDIAGTRHTVLHGSVESTRLWATGDGAAALELGWEVWNQAEPGEGAFGRRFLLARLCGIAAVGGHHEWFGRLLDAAVQWRRSARGAEAVGAAEVCDLADGLFGAGAGHRARLAKALETARGQGHRAKLCWMLLAAGTVVDDPVEPWSEAHTIAAEIGSPLLRQELRRLVEAYGVQLPVHRARDRGLTEVQVRIVELVEQGLTNRQIARDLQISEKTVENHLTRLFARFGLRTRYGLATARLTARRDEPEAVVVAGR